MISMILKAITALGLPVAVLLSGGWILSRVSGLGSVVNQLTQAGHTVPTALNRRWFGYGTREVQVYWHALQESDAGLRKRPSNSIWPSRFLMEEHSQQACCGRRQL